MPLYTVSHGIALFRLVILKEESVTSGVLPSSAKFGRFEIKAWQAILGYLIAGRLVTPTPADKGSTSDPILSWSFPAYS
jgi:hypothetical protein